MSFFCKGGTFLAKKIVVYVYVGYSKGRNFCEIRIENLTMQHIEISSFKDSIHTFRISTYIKRLHDWLIGSLTDRSTTFWPNG